MTGFPTDDLPERDKETVAGCDHAVLKLERLEASPAPHGRCWVDELSCLTCPTNLLYVEYERPGDDIEMRPPLWG